MLPTATVAELLLLLVSLMLVLMLFTPTCASSVSAHVHSQLAEKVVEDPTSTTHSGLSDAQRRCPVHMQPSAITKNLQFSAIEVPIQMPCGDLYSTAFQSLKVKQ